MGGGHTDTKTVCQTVSVEVKYRNTQCRACGKLNISKSKNSNFEHSTKCILIKNLNLIKTVFKFNFLSFFFFILFYSFLILFYLFLLFLLFFSIFIIFFYLFFLIFLFYFLLSFKYFLLYLFLYIF